MGFSILCILSETHFRRFSLRGVLFFPLPLLLLWARAPSSHVCLQNSRPSCHHWPYKATFSMSRPCIDPYCFQSPQLHSRTSRKWLDLSLIQVTTCTLLVQAVCPIGTQFISADSLLRMLLLISCPIYITPSFTSRLKCHLAMMRHLLPPACSGSPTIIYFYARDFGVCGRRGSRN